MTRKERALYGLASWLETFERRRERIEQLKQSQNSFKRELYQRHMSKLAKLAEDFGETVSKIETMLETGFYAQRDTRSYMDIIDELEKIKCKLNQSNFSETVVFNLDSLFSAVEQLLTKNTSVGA